MHIGLKMRRQILKHGLLIEEASFTRHSCLSLHSWMSMETFSDMHLQSHHYSPCHLLINHLIIEPNNLCFKTCTGLSHSGLISKSKCLCLSLILKLKGKLAFHREGRVQVDTWVSFFRKKMVIMKDFFQEGLCAWWGVKGQDWWKHSLTARLAEEILPVFPERESRRRRGYDLWYEVIVVFSYQFSFASPKRLSLHEGNMVYAVL